MAVAGGWLVADALRGSDRPSEGLRSRAGAGGRDEPARDTEASRSITVARPADELHDLWRDPERLSLVMGGFAEIDSSDGDRLRWSVDGPLDREIAWETDVVEEERGELIRWRTPEDAMLPNEGSVRFREARGDRGTVVTLSISFDPPGGTLGEAALKRLEIVPESLVATALDRFKSLAETGEIPTLRGNPSGRGKGDLL